MDLLLCCRAESLAVQDGLVEGGRGWPLTERGQQQSDLLGARLARAYQVAALYSSPLEEAAETAARIGGILGLAPTTVPELRDMDRGQLAGRPLAAVRQRRDCLAEADIFTPFPEGESFAEMHVRVVKAINALVAQADGRTIALVMHPAPIQAFFLAFMRYAIEQRGEMALGCDPAALHHLRRRPDGRKEIVRLNDVGHLLAL